MSEGAAKMASRSGRCLCGALRFSATPATLGVDVCHCGMCRRWTGGALMVVACEGVTVADGADLGIYRSSEYGERVFCKTCGSSLIWRMQDGSSAYVAVSAFDDQSGFALAQEIFIDDKPAFYAFAGGARKLTGAEFAAMMQAGAEQADG
jgi:hypothetical protein